VTLIATRVPRSEVGQLTGPWTGRSFPLAANEFEEFLKISVCDSGIGMTPEALEDLFVPFSQIDSGLARKFEGTGLGLVLIKLLAELHGGTVAVQSKVGEGACFTVWLPLRAPEEVARVAARMSGDAALETPHGERPVALVVEDDFKSADLIRLQLEAEGFRVLHATSAEDALVVAADQPLALITLDIMLPNMDGWEFLSRLKQMPPLRDIPVVIVSIVADRNKGFALGAAAVIQKPISRKDLVDSLLALSLIPGTPGGPLRVLVIDDDPKCVELIAVCVEEAQGTVTRAYGGREGIDIAMRELPDLIVLDLMMPDVNGFDVVAALHEEETTCSIPILIVTAERVSDDDRYKLNGFVSTIMEKSEFGGGRFGREIRRAMAGRGMPV
jgi:CheY-like chemotaxis protein